MQDQRSVKSCSSIAFWSFFSVLKPSTSIFTGDVWCSNALSLPAPASSCFARQVEAVNPVLPCWSKDGAHASRVICQNLLRRVGSFVSSLRRQATARLRAPPVAVTADVGRISRSRLFDSGPRDVRRELLRHPEQEENQPLPRSWRARP